MSPSATLVRPLRRLSFPIELALRAQLRRSPMVTLLSVGAAASAVLLALCVRSAADGFRAELDAARRAARNLPALEIRAAGADLPEALLDDVRRQPGVVAASASLSTTLQLRSSACPGCVLHVVGRDLTAASSEDARFLDHDLALRDPLLLLGNEPALLLPESVSDELGLGAGQWLRVEIGGDRHSLRIAGLVRAGTVTAAYLGRTAVMDLWSLQALLGREGRVDRIQVRLEPGREVAQTQRALEERLRPYSARVSRRTWAAATDGALGTLEQVAHGLVVGAVLLGALLLQLTLIRDADARGRELGSMESAGMHRLGLWGFVLLDGGLPIALGAALGGLIGTCWGPDLARVLLDLPLAPSSPGEPSPGSGLTPLAMAGLLLLSVLPVGAVSLRRARHPTGNQAQPGTHARPAAALWLLPAIGLAVAHALPLPAARLVTSALVGVLSLPLGIRLLLLDSAGRARPWLRGLPRVGDLVGSFLLSSPTRSYAASCSLICLFLVLTGASSTLLSLTTSIDSWLAALHPGGILVRPQSGGLGFASERIRAETLLRIRETPGVEDVAVHDNIGSHFEGEPITIGALSSEVLRRRGAAAGGTGALAPLLEDLQSGKIAVSHAFRTRFGIEPGDTLQIQTDRGPQQLRVAGIFADYAGRGGSLHLDLDTFHQLFDREGADFLVIWTAEPSGTVMEAIRQRTLGLQALDLRPVAAGDGPGQRLLAHYAGLLQLVTALGLGLCTLGILHLLGSGLLRQRRLVRQVIALGARPLEVSGAACLEITLLLAIAALGGIALGALAGQACSELLVTHFGWPIRHRLDSRSLVFVATAGLTLLVALGGLALAMVRRFAAQPLQLEEGPGT